ncbi:MAG: PEFG-CTERM sorting domain-containing protein [Thaumarchaeota archaeon]|nr:MAG: PEFG-CTERM sorting domain-containing protein [Nitrososphaerota archaeon]
MPTPEFGSIVSIILITSIISIIITSARARLRF